MKAVVVEGVNQISVKEVPMPRIEENEVLVQIKIANICSQTDTHMVQGIFDSGLEYPFILGHEAAGVVVEVGSALKNCFFPGDRVACKGGYGCMAEYAAFPEDALIKLPDSVSLEEGSMFEVSACAYALIRQTVQMGDKVLLIGQGCAGLLGTAFAKIAGASLIVAADINAHKRDLAKRYGAQVVLDPMQEDYEDRLAALTDGQGFDVTLDFAGMGKTMNDCIRWLKKQGRIGMFGVKCEPFEFDFFQLHGKMAAIFTAGHEYSYNEIPFRKMLDFSVSGQIALHEFVSHKLKLEDVEKGFELIKNRDETVLRIGLIP